MMTTYHHIDNSRATVRGVGVARHARSNFNPVVPLKTKRSTAQNHNLTVKGRLLMTPQTITHTPTVFIAVRAIAVQPQSNPHFRHKECARRRDLIRRRLSFTD